MYPNVMRTQQRNPKNKYPDLHMYCRQVLLNQSTNQLMLYQTDKHADKSAYNNYNSVTTDSLVKENARKNGKFVYKASALGVPQRTTSL